MQMYIRIYVDSRPQAVELYLEASLQGNSLMFLVLLIKLKVMNQVILGEYFPKCSLVLAITDFR